MADEKLVHGWVNEMDHKLRTPIHIAVRQGHCDQVEILLDKGAEILVPDRINRTAYHKARSPGVLKMLIDRGGDPYRSGKHGNYPEFQQNSTRAVHEWGNALFLMLEKYFYFFLICSKL